MPSFKSLMTPPTNKEIKSYQRVCEQSYKEAVKSGKQHPDLKERMMQSHYFNMAYNAVYRRNEDLLDEIYEAHQQISPEDRDFQYHIHFNRACLRIAQHRFDEAIELLEALDLQRKVMHRSHILHLLLDIFDHLGNHKQAAFYVHKFFAHWLTDNNESYVYYGGFPNLLEILTKANEFEKVIEYGLERIALKFRFDMFVYFLVAYSYQQLDDLENALKYYRYIFRKKYPYPEAFINVGEYYGLKLGNKKENIKYYIRAIKACGNDLQYKPLLSRLYHNLKQLFKELNDEKRANAYRRDMFKAMGSPLLSDLLALFSRDQDSIELYRTWLQEKLALNASSASN